MQRDRRPPQSDIPTKANRVLNCILIGLIIIALKCWHLCMVQYEERLDLSRAPQVKEVVEPAKRGTIRDRFNTPLAINKIQYRAAVLYSQIRQIPSIVWERDAETGKRVKFYQRKNHIANLAKLLAEELSLDKERVEDLIHAKASLYHNVPFVLKEDLTEKEYYRLKAREKDWVGLYMERASVRHYPLGPVAGDVIGYLGAISKEEYEAVMQEIRALRNYLQESENGGEPPFPRGIATPVEALRRLQDLEERAYTINDSIGKAGIEGRFEEDLRGYRGKKRYESDARGNFLKELPGARPPLSGQRILLSLSAELQEFAEQLLIQNETIRKSRITPLLGTRAAVKELPEPWMRGGAIVALDPKTGEVLALASYPRFDPNDFVLHGTKETIQKKQERITRWFENRNYVAALWDQTRPLERERFDPLKGGSFDEALPLSWNIYLERLLPKENPVWKGLSSVATIKGAIELQRAMQELVALSEQERLYPVLNYLYPEHPHGRPQPAATREAMEEALHMHKVEIAYLVDKAAPYLEGLPHNYDKGLLVDLCRLVVREDQFDDTLLASAGKQTLKEYREASSAKKVLESCLKKRVQALFHTLSFQPWRDENETSFLKMKRAEERASGRYAKPYIDLLDAEEKRQFKTFWKRHQWQLLHTFLTGTIPGNSSIASYLSAIASGSDSSHTKTLQKILGTLPQSEHIPYLKTLRGYHDLTRPLLGYYRGIGHYKGQQLERHLAAAFYPFQGYGYGRSYAYRQATTQGSLFKLVTSYVALKQLYHKQEKLGHASASLNPLTIDDRIFKIGKATYVGYHQDGAPIPQQYKGGRIPRSHTHSIGFVDLIRALVVSSNSYFSLLASDVIEDPEDLAQGAKELGLGEKSGIDLPAEIAGRVPNDLRFNRDGLYSMAIGQHSLVVTPLQTAVMLAALVNGGKVLKPQVIGLKVGKMPNRRTDCLITRSEFPYQESLNAVGIDFPLFSAASGWNAEPLITRIPVETTRQIDLPESVRQVLLEAMGGVVQNIGNRGVYSLTSLYRDDPQAVRDFIAVKGELFGKTSTAESIERQNLDRLLGTNIYNHIWFGGVGMEEGEPEIVVVAYLRYGAWGKDASPLVAQIVRKWRSIKKKQHCL